MNIEREYLMQFTRLHGPVAFTSKDVDYLLEGNPEIETFRYTTTRSANRINDLLEDASNLLSNGYSKAAFLLTANKDLTPPLTMAELSPLAELINSKPSTRELFWAFLYDESLPTNTLCLTIIITHDE